MLAVLYFYKIINTFHKVYPSKLILMSPLIDFVLLIIKPTVKPTIKPLTITK